MSDLDKRYLVSLRGEANALGGPSQGQCPSYAAAGTGDESNFVQKDFAFFGPKRKENK